jgi:phosphatidylethanolamine/phosphatidyl-N-methylethanolamine N-methyltransferase
MPSYSEEPLPATLDSPIEARRLQRIYDRTAAFYDGLVGAEQVQAKTMALPLLNRRPGERLLEIGVGTGWLFARILARSGLPGAVAIDLAPGMLSVARERLAAEVALFHAPLMLADARALPFRSASFDCAVCTHALDVMTSVDADLALRELHRVLSSNGRLVCVNLTAGEGEDSASTSDWQRRFAADPEYFGGARPVLMAPALTHVGFDAIQRHYSGHGGGWPSEVLLAKRP